MFDHGAGPRLRTHVAGKGLEGGLHSSVGQGLFLRPAWKGRGSTWKGGPLECGVLEFGGRALSEGV